MEYCLCVKPNDKNLLHIVARHHLQSALYAAYEVVATAPDEEGAFEVAAELVQKFCDAHDVVDFSSFMQWVREVRA